MQQTEPSDPMQYTMKVTLPLEKKAQTTQRAFLGPSNSLIKRQSCPETFPKTHALQVCLCLIQSQIFLVNSIDNDEYDSRHRKTHDKPYHCVLCPKGFALRNDLDRHRRTHLPRHWGAFLYLPILRRRPLEMVLPQRSILAAYEEPPFPT